MVLNVHPLTNSNCLYVYVDVFKKCGTGDNITLSKTEVSFSTHCLNHCV